MKLTVFCDGKVEHVYFGVGRLHGHDVFLTFECDGYRVTVPTFGHAFELEAL